MRKILKLYFRFAMNQGYQPIKIAFMYGCVRVCVCWYHVHNNWNENNNEINRQQLERIVFNEFTQFTGEFIDVNRLE